jgi:hypothetical protein
VGVVGVIPPETASEFLTLGILVAGVPAVAALLVRRRRRPRRGRRGRLLRSRREVAPRGTAAGLLADDRDEDVIMLAVPDKVDPPDDEDDVSYAG